MLTELIHLVRQDFAAEKTRYGLRSFDDLLLTVRQALSNPQQQALIRRAVRSRFQAVIIDECQDSDGIQIDVFQQLFLNNSADEKRSFIVIGDPKQSIYRFRGADLGSYRALIAKTERALPMVTNWRSDAALIQALNRLTPLSQNLTITRPLRPSLIKRCKHRPKRLVRGCGPGPWRDETAPALLACGVGPTNAIRPFGYGPALRR